MQILSGTNTNEYMHLEIQFFHVTTLVLVVPEMYGKDRGYSFVRRARHFLFWLLCDFFCGFLPLNIHFIDGDVTIPTQVIKYNQFSPGRSANKISLFTSN
jgi:hypothetical protein